MKSGDYRVEAEVGDAFAGTGQRIDFEGVNAGSFDLPAGQLQWTPKPIVAVRDGRLTVRLYLKDDTTKAGLRNLNFTLIDRTEPEASAP